jgi:hypothetical protein
MENGHKVISDFILTTKDAIFVLQEWLAILERQQGQERIEPGQFEVIYQRVREIGLGSWLERASGYDLTALSQVVNEAVQSEDRRLGAEPAKGRGRTSGSQSQS